MTDTTRTTVFTPTQKLAALRELVRALDRRHPHLEREGEWRIAQDAQLLRHQAVARIEELQLADSAGYRVEAALAAAIMTDDGGPSPDTGSESMPLNRLRRIGVSIALMIGAASSAFAQPAAPPLPDRRSTIETAAAAKAEDLHPYEVTSAERLIAAIARPLTSQTTRWHPFFDNAYAGAGFAAGLGYTFHTSAYGTLDVRGSYGINSSKLAEVEYVAPRLFGRRGELALLGGWRDATEVAFHGIGMNTTSDLVNYRFEEPFGSAMLTIRPARGALTLGAGVEVSQWDIKRSAGLSPSVDQSDSLQSLAGLDAPATFLHAQAAIGIDRRHSSGYTRRGGFYGVTGHDYTDRDEALGFRQVDYEAVQHIPILRESWVVSLRGAVTTTWAKADRRAPFYMLPSLGGGHTLRGFTSLRFRDHHSLLLQAEWRIIANRYVETAVFYDAGKVAARTSELDLNRLKSDYGFGFRIHAAASTLLRIEIARSTEGTRLVFAGSPVF